VFSNLLLEKAYYRKRKRGGKAFSFAREKKDIIHRKYEDLIEIEEGKRRESLEK